MFIAEKDNLKVFLDLAHLREKKWSGGKFRSRQTYEIFEQAGFTFTPVVEPKRPGRLRILLWAITGILRFGLYRPFHLDSLRTTGYNYFKLSHYKQQYPGVNAWLIEGTGFGALQNVAILKSFGIKVILAPINVESLAPYPGAWTHSLSPIDRLKVELKYYQLADAVFCISLEEAWLLSIMDVETYFLPYHPPKELLKKIEQRRAARAGVKKEGILYYANYFNSPNYLGLKKFVEEHAYINKTIRIAGLGIEKILPLIEGKKEFIVLGELSDEELENELISCEKVLFNHYPTSGMLTRVPELLLSGIPVEGNLAALKAYSLFVQDDQNDIGRGHLSALASTGSKRLLEKLSNHRSS